MAATQAPSPESETTPQQGPTINSLAQFTKDLSFENPNAPNSLRAREGAGPAININVNVNATQVAPDEFNVELKLDGDAKIGTEVLFAFELVYGGLFRLSGIPPEQVHPVVMIECPRLLFPFARQIVADAVRHGGFPPLYIDPIDFVGLYNLTVQQQGQPNGQAAPEGATLN